METNMFWPLFHLTLEEENNNIANKAGTNYALTNVC
jgi:hypothetical protein